MRSGFLVPSTENYKAKAANIIGAVKQVMQINFKLFTKLVLQFYMPIL